MKQKKLEKIRELATRGDDEFVMDLSTGKFYINGSEVTPEQWNEYPNKLIRIDLGTGMPDTQMFNKN